MIFAHILFHNEDMQSLRLHEHNSYWHSYSDGKNISFTCADNNTRTYAFSDIKKIWLIATACLIFCLSTFAQQIPETPQPQHTIDYAFVTHTFLDFSLSTFDATYSAHTNNLPGVYETDGLYGPHPTPTRFYLTSLGISSAATFAAYEAKKHHQRWWGLLQAADEISHFVGIMQTHNAVTTSNQFCKGNPTFKGCSNGH